MWRNKNIDSIQLLLVTVIFRMSVKPTLLEVVVTLRWFECMA